MWGRRRRILDGRAPPRKFPGNTFLQLRDPLRVISSFVGLGFFSRPDAARTRIYAAMHSTYLEDDLVDSMRWWVDWNMRPRHTLTLVYRVEELNEDLLGRCCRWSEPIRRGRATRWRR